MKSQNNHYANHPNKDLFVATDRPSLLLPKFGGKSLSTEFAVGVRTFTNELG